MTWAYKRLTNVDQNINLVIRLNSKLELSVVFYSLPTICYHSFLNELGRITGSADYQPTYQDILNSRQQTIGLVQFRLTIREIDFL